MAALFTALFAKLSAIIGWIGDLAKGIFTAAVDMLRDVAAWVFDQLLSIVVSAVQAIDTSALSSASTSWGSLPADVSNILSLLGVGTAITIISAAIGIRLVLQLIPFVRLGS